MSTLRSFKREMIRNQCYQKNRNTKAFKDEWERIHYGKTEEFDDEGNIISVKSNKVNKKKQRHYDDGRAYVRHLKAVKSFISNMKNNAQKSNVREKVC